MTGDGLDPVLDGALDAILAQAPRNRRLRDLVTRIRAAAGDQRPSVSEAPADDAVGDRERTEAQRLFDEADRVRRALATGQGNATEVFELWTRSAEHAEAARAHEAPVTVAVLTAAAEVLEATPSMFAPDGHRVPPPVETTADLRAWLSRRCGERVVPGDDEAAAEALGAWARINRAFALVRAPNGHSDIVVAHGVREELEILAATAVLTGPRSARAARAVIDELVVGERGEVVRELTASQTWSAAVSRAVGRVRSGAMTEPRWWKQDAFGARTAGLAANDAHRREAWGWDPGYRVIGRPARRGHEAHEAHDGVVAFDVAAFDDEATYSFVIDATEPGGPGVWRWPSPTVDELGGPIPWPAPTEMAVAIGARLGIEARGMFDLDECCCPAPSLPGCDHAPPGLPDVDFWRRSALAAGAELVLVAGTVSTRGLQLIVAISGADSIEVAPAPWLLIVTGAGTADDDDDDDD